VLDKIFQLVGNAFACGALFSTGMGSVGQVEKLSGKGLIVPLFLSLTKSLITPIIARFALIPIFDIAAKSSTKRDLFVNFIFLVRGLQV
jgi:hypothetical protein